MKEGAVRAGPLPPVMEQQRYRGGDDDPPSRHLWVGNVAMETPESVLRDKFSRFGELESVTVYPLRQYAFVNFRKQEDAERAKEELAGAHIAGQPIRVEFAKGPRPSRHLVVSGISSSLTKEMLEAEFLKHGSIEDFKLVRERNNRTTALVDYFKTEDAINALESLNRRRLGDEELKIDYKQAAPKRASSAAPPSAPYSRDETPSEVLWIALPLNSKLDEDAIQKLFSPFGEIVRIKKFPARGYCFVQFRNARDAAAAKSSLNGKAFHGHKLHIEFSTSEVGPMESRDDSPDASLKRVKPSAAGLNPQLLAPPQPQPQPQPQVVPLPETGPWGWQGLIAKAGVVLCQVRGFPASGRVDTPIPEVVNCTSRTDLEMLAKHMYSAAAEFNVMFFRPVREVDVPPYQELVHNLREKRRAGVARLGDGITLFLVPPSPFSETVLRVARGDCLFGLVLRIQPGQSLHQPVPLQFQTPPGSFHMNPELAASIYQQQQQQPGGAPSQNGFPSLPPGWSAPADQPAGFSAPVAAPAPPPPPPPAAAIPQLPIDQLAQLTALLKQSQQQQPAPQNWAPHQSGFPPQQQQQPPAAAALPQFQGDPEMIQRTISLAAQLLNNNRSS